MSLLVSVHTVQQVCVFHYPGPNETQEAADTYMKQQAIHGDRVYRFCKISWPVRPG